MIFKKTIFYLILGLFVSAASLWTVFGLAKEINVVNKTAPLPSVGVRYDILNKIREAVSLLKSSPPLLYEMTRMKNGKPSGGNLVRKQIALAILDKTTGEIFEKRVWVREREIKNYRETGIINLDPANLATSDVAINVRVEWWNSFNSLYDVKNNPALVVLADKYLMPSNLLTALPEKSKNQYTDIIYAPYSKDLHVPELIEAGKQYINKNVDEAFSRLERDGVVSLSPPAHAVTGDISKDFIKNIILVEHTDPDSFNAATDGGKELTERVLVLIGANQSSAYRYTGSPAGASGLAQFIKPTYKAIVSRYPRAHLIKDYNLGMADHVNAIKAMVLFFDNYRGDIKNHIVRRDIIEQLGISEEMLAAAYNGGPANVTRSVNKLGLAWISGQLNLPRAKSILKKETLTYLKKFRSIKELNIF